MHLVLGEVLEMRDRQNQIWGAGLETSPERWLVIMLEELGEAGRAYLHEAVEHKPVEMSSAEELVQLTAILIRALEVWPR
jgi:hypothetical protein